MLLKVKHNKNVLSQKSASNNELNISSSFEDVAPRLLKNLVQRGRRALAIGLKPELVLEGSGGTYFIHDMRKAKLAVFKPADEEPYAVNNPRGYLPHVDQSTYLREGIVPGEACLREVAAFVLDHEGFSDVPMTTLVEARHPNFNSNGSQLNVSQGGASIGRHSILSGGTSSQTAEKKVGSLQEFMRTECSMDDLSPSKISVDEVHKIAVLDIRLLNADRNAANLLCRRRSDNFLQLIPIDHGFCLRSSADVSWMDWCWLDWPQLKQPVSDATRSYIMRLDVEKDAKTLQERFNIDQKAIDYFCASTRLLKLGISKGLTLYEIACMCCRNDNLGEVPSRLEALFSMADDLSELAIENGRWHHSAASKALTEQLALNQGSLLGSCTALSGIKKSKSSLEFGQTMNGLAGLQLVVKDETMPDMVKSSASDSSSETFEGERDEQIEWAAEMVLDVSLDKSMAISKTRGDRSMSIESDGSSDSGNQGFWRFSPCDCDEDDKSWSSCESLEETSKPFPVSLTPPKSLRRISMARSPDPTRAPPNAFNHLSMSMCRGPTKVTFDTETIVFDPVRSDNSDSNIAQAVVAPDLPEVPAKPGFSGLKRSQSYSGLSVSQMAETRNDLTDINITRPEYRELYRKYFISFMDTVINQEATAAAKLANSK